MDTDQFTPQQLEEIKSVFDIYDTDTGTIGTNDVNTRVLHHLGFSPEEKELKGMQANIDGADRINFE